MTKKHGDNSDRSIIFKDNGITMHCNDLNEDESFNQLLYHSTLKKYSLKASKWFGMCVSARCFPYFRMAIYSEEIWKQSDEMDEEVKLIT